MVQVSYYTTVDPDHPEIYPEEGVNATEGAITLADNSVDESKNVWLIVLENGVTNPELSDPERGMIPNEENTGK